MSSLAYHFAKKNNMKTAIILYNVLHVFHSTKCQCNLFHLEMYVLVQHLFQLKNELSFNVLFVYDTNGIFKY